MRERSVPAILAGALLSAATAVRADIIGARAAIDLAKARLAKIKRSSRAHDAWLLLAGVGCRLPKFRSFLTPSSGPLCHN